MDNIFWHPDKVIDVADSAKTTEKNKIHTGGEKKTRKNN